jgi:hypothetical protein
LLREAAKVLNMDVDKLIPSPEDIKEQQQQAALQQQLMMAQQQQEGIPDGQIN